MGDEQNKKETCRGNKVIIGGEKSLYFLTGELFSYSRLSPLLYL